jgi:SSS family solute:Na+ symporter
LADDAPPAIGLLAGLRIFSAKWARMRQYFQVISLLEYLKIIYDLPTRQLPAGVVHC